MVAIGSSSSVYGNKKVAFWGDILRSWKEPFMIPIGCCSCVVVLSYYGTK